MMSGPTLTMMTTSSAGDRDLLLPPTGDTQGEAVTSNLSSRSPENNGPPNLGVSVSDFIWIYVCPVILLMGVVGNCLTIAVMRRKRLRGGTVAIYLILMAIADTCFLVVGIIPEWLEALDVVVFKKIHPVTCKLEKFVGYTSGDTAIWLLVVFTFDRFVAVCFPLRKSEVCTTKRAWILGACCLLLGVFKNLHVFWTRGAEYSDDPDGGPPVLKSNCGRPTKEYDHFESFVRPWIAFALVSAIPFFLICAFNIGIVKTLLCMPIPASPDSGTTRTERKYSQTTLMCISVSILFLVTITPSIVIVIGRPYWDDKESPNYMYITAKGINNALVFMNHSLNFFLYCLTGRRFREQLVLMFKSCCRIEDGFPNSAAQKASLYLKTIHKFSQEFITSTGPRTEDTTAGTSVSTGLTNANLSRQSTKSASKKIKSDKSKESFKSLDSESSMSDPVVDMGVDAKSMDGVVPPRTHPIRPPTPGASVEARLRPHRASYTNQYTTPTRAAAPPATTRYSDPELDPATTPYSDPEPDSDTPTQEGTQTQTRCSVYMDEEGDERIGENAGEQVVEQVCEQVSGHMGEQMGEQLHKGEQEGSKVTTPDSQKKEQLTGSNSTTGSEHQYATTRGASVGGVLTDKAGGGQDREGARENAIPTLENAKQVDHYYHRTPSVPSSTEQCRPLAVESQEKRRGPPTSGLQIFSSDRRDGLGEGTHV